MVSFVAPQALSRDSNAGDAQQQTSILFTMTFSLDDFSALWLIVGAMVTPTNKRMIPAANNFFSM